MFCAAVITIITGMKVAKENALVEISEYDESIDAKDVTRGF